VVHRPTACERNERGSGPMSAEREQRLEERRMPDGILQLPVLSD
jgi:hypothetical protein